LATFVVASAIFQVLYLNKSLQHFSTSIVTPVYYVFFSTATLITSAVLFQGFNVSSFINGATIVLGFLVIVIGVALLFQYNLKLNKLAQKEPKMNTDTSMLPDISASSIDEPQTDQNPFTLMAMTFPFRTSHGQEDGRSDVALNLEQELIVAAGIKNNVPARLSASNIDFTPLDKNATT
jgi:magnesium-transporting ATPase (P-type)